MLRLDNPSIVARNISKTYSIPVRAAGRIPLLGRRHKVEVQAVKSATFVVEQGEAVGVLGHNGSGKSTLLRILAGSERPDSGDVHVTAQPSLLGVSAALQPKLTGHQNIRLGLLAMGLAKEEVDELTSEVAEISDLGDAIYRPMNTYSSGMQARLTFSIATSCRPSILMIDEALGTGDATFNEIARKRMDQLLSEASTLFVVSHSAAVLRKTCKRAIWLHQGQVVCDGDLNEISKEYAIWGEHKTLRREEEAEEVITHNLAQYEPPKIYMDSELARITGRSFKPSSL